MLANPIVLYTTYGIAAEPNRRDFRVWNIRSHVTTLLIAIPDKEILGGSVFGCVLWLTDTFSNILQQLSEEVAVGSTLLGKRFNTPTLSATIQ